MSLSARIIALAQAIGADVKNLTTKQGDLTTLSTTSKSNLVSAINEIAVALASSGVQINDALGNGATGVTWSADKIFDTIEAAKAAVKSDLTNGASAALDTFAEFAAALGNDANFAATIATGLSSRIRFDAAQVLDAAQKAQACTNIGIGDPESDLAAAYVAAKA